MIADAYLNFQKLNVSHLSFLHLLCVTLLYYQSTFRSSTHWFRLLIQASLVVPEHSIMFTLNQFKHRCYQLQQVVNNHSESVALRNSLGLHQNLYFDGKWLYSFPRVNIFWGCVFPLLSSITICLQFFSYIGHFSLTIDSNSFDLKSVFVIQITSYEFLSCKPLPDPVRSTKSTCLQEKSVSCSANRVSTCRRSM